MDIIKASLKAGAMVVAVGVTIYLLNIRKRSHPPLRAGISQAVLRLLQQGRRKLLTNILDVGGFFGADIGGSLSKFVFFLPDAELIQRLMSRVPPKHIEEAHWRAKVESINDIARFLLSKSSYGRTGVRDEHLSFHVSELGGSFHFIRFETRRMDGAISLAKSHGLHEGMSTICATGGGSHRFAPSFKAELGVDIEPRDEIDCLVKGLAFLMGYVDSEAYTFHGRKHVDRPMTGITYPYLLVNIGSGVGFILVHSETKWERVSGTSLGGGTFYGLCHMLTNLSSFDEMLNLAEDGNNAMVDLTVGDIYGGDYNKFGLKSSTIASSFGKAIMWNFPDRRQSTAKAADEEKVADDFSRAAATGGPAISTRLSDYKRSAAKTLNRIIQDAGSFGAEVIGGKGPSRKLASRLPSPSESSTPPSSPQTGVAKPGMVNIAPPPSAPHSRKSSPGAATPLQPRGAAVDEEDVEEDYSSDRAGPSADSSDGDGHSGSRKYESKDVSRALLIMISNNIGQLAYLNAVRYNCKHVYFAGNFLRHENTIAMRTLAYAITFWSQGNMEGLFLRHEGYCGAIGAFLSTLQTADDLPDTFEM